MLQKCVLFLPKNTQMCIFKKLSETFFSIDFFFHKNGVVLILKQVIAGAHTTVWKYIV